MVKFRPLQDYILHNDDTVHFAILWLFSQVIFYIRREGSDIICLRDALEWKFSWNQFDLEPDCVGLYTMGPFDIVMFEDGEIA